MGISLSTARVLAPLSFAVDFAAQQYGMLSSPNMKDVHDANLSYFSPQPYFIAAFFFPQQILQVIWLWRLWRARPEEVANDRHVALMVDYAPFYALGNFCIASWMIFWNQSALRASNVFVVINSVAQLAFLATRLPRMDLSSTTSILTHIVAKSFAGIGVLDLLHNGSVAYAVHQTAGPLVRILTGVGFGAMAAVSDWVFGGCLVYNLVALMVGQRGYGDNGWANLLGAYALGAAIIVVARNLIWTPYVRSSEYQSLR